MLAQVMVIIAVLAVGALVMITNTMRLRKTLDELEEERGKNAELSEKVRTLDAEVRHLTEEIVKRCQQAAEAKAGSKAESTSGRKVSAPLRRKKKEDD